MTTCKKSEKMSTPPPPDLSARIHWEVCCGDDVQISSNLEHNFIWPMETIGKMYTLTYFILHSFLNDISDAVFTFFIQQAHVH